MAQVNLESGAYKAFYGEITKNGTKVQKGPSNLVVYFAGNAMLTNFPKSNPARIIHFNTKTIKEGVISGIKTTTLQGMDVDGKHCLLSIGYDSIKEIYLLFLQYPEYGLYYECKPTTDRPWSFTPEEKEPIIALF